MGIEIVYNIGSIKEKIGELQGYIDALKDQLEIILSVKVVTSKSKGADSLNTLNEQIAINVQNRIAYMIGMKQVLEKKLDEMIQADSKAFGGEVT